MRGRIHRFIKFAVSSLIGFLTDNAAFTIVLFAASGLGLLRRHCIFVALIAARIVSGLVTYLLNRVFVFDSTAKASSSFARYWLLVVLIATLSYTATAVLSAVSDARGFVITCIKIAVETLLFILSYTMQKNWVFARPRQSVREVV